MRQTMRIEVAYDDEQVSKEQLESYLGDFLGAGANVSHESPDGSQFTILGLRMDGWQPLDLPEPQGIESDEHGHIEEIHQ